MISLKLSSF